MDTPLRPALRRSLSAAASRRGLLAAVTAGLLTARQLADGGIDIEAKKKTRNRKRRKNNRKKNDSIEVRVDAICLGPTDNTGFTLNDGSLFAQTFTALSTGRLVLAEIFVAASAAGSADLTLQLRTVDASGVPTNEVLAETSVTIPDASDGEFAIVLPFADPPPVVANSEFALVLSKTGSRNVSWKGHRTASCDGRVFVSEPSSEPFDPSVDDLDLIFTTVVSS